MDRMSNFCMQKVVYFLVLLVLTAGFLSFTAFASEEEDFNVAKQAYNEEFYDASKDLFKNFVEKYPESGKVLEAKLFIAKSLFFKDDFQKASQKLSKLIGSADNDYIKAKALYWMGRIAYKSKKYKQAVADFERVLKEYPDVEIIWRVLYLQGISYLELEDIDKAKNNFKEVIKKGKGSILRESAFKMLSSLYYNRQDYDKLGDLATEWKNEFSKSRYLDYIYFYLAESKYYFENYEDSLDLYKKALENLSADELRDSVYQGMGWVYLEQEKYKKAEELFQEIFSKETRLYSLGTLFYNMEEYKKACNIFSEFIENYSGSEYIYNVYLGNAESLYELGRINDAIVYYMKIVQNSESIEDKYTLEEGLRGLGWSYLKINEYKSAIEYFSKLSESSEEDIIKLSAQINIADVYQDAGDYSKALSAYEQALKEFPNSLYSDYIQLQIGICFLKKNDFEASLLAFRNLKDNFPKSKFKQEGVYYAALSHTFLGNFDAAIKILNELIDNYPEGDYLKQSYLLLLQVQAEKGDSEDILDIFQRASRQFSGDKQFLAKLQFQKAMFFIDRGNYREAKRAFKEILHSFSNSGLKEKALFYLASVYHIEGEYRYAKTFYRRVIEDLPQINYAYQSRLNLAEILWEENNYKEAKKLLKDNLSFSLPREIQINTRLTQVEFLIDQEYYDEALDICDALLDEYPDSKGVFFFKKARIFEKKREYGKAYEFYTKSKESGYTAPELYFYKGYASEKIGNVEAAIKSFFELTYKYPTNRRFLVKSYLHIGRLYEQLDKPDEAKKAYQKIVEMDVEEKKYAIEKLEDLNQEERRN